jgi:hypothetical protein
LSKIGRESYRQIRRGLPEGNRGEQLEAKFDRVRSILDYEVPAVRMFNYSFDDAVDAFIGINTLGVKLKVKENVDRHHLLPRAQFPERDRHKADTIANIAFITGPVNRSVGAPSPEARSGPAVRHCG